MFDDLQCASTKHEEVLYPRLFVAQHSDRVGNCRRLRRILVQQPPHVTILAFPHNTLTNSIAISTIYIGIILSEALEEQLKQ